MDLPLRSSPPTTTQTGQQAENAAQAFLEEQGFSLVTRNYRSYRGEIDLVMQQGALLIFVEVRLRRHAQFGGALASVTYAKQQKIIACARAFLHHHPVFSGNECRFDVIAMQYRNNVWQTEWIPAAFC